MNKAEIETAVLKILKERFLVKDHYLQNKDSELIKDIDLDSLDILEAILIFEQDFHLSIPDDEAESIKTINDLINYIDKQLNS